VPVQTNLGRVRSSCSHIYVFHITNSDVFEVGGPSFLKQILGFGIQFSDRIIKCEFFKVILLASPGLDMKS